MAKKSVFEDKAKTKGFSFGLTSGIITTLGMIAGLESATESKFIIIAGIVSLAFADAFSDSFGIHISAEAEGDKRVWAATFYTFFAEFFFAMLFVVPFLIFGIKEAFYASITYGLLMISFYSWVIAKKQNKNIMKTVGEHLLISVVVIIVTHYVGDLVRLII